MKLFISLILFPFLSWYFQYYFSKKEKLNFFKKHWTCYYGDWIFVPINLLFVYSIKLQSHLFSNN
jgi:hypothetical protein